VHAGVGAGYYGLDSVESRDGSVFGRPVKIFTSSHERSHLYQAAAMAPGAPVRECVILTWEGMLGSLYHWQDHGARVFPVPVLSQPGGRYAALFALADPGFPDAGADPRPDYAGKLMALAAFGAGSEPEPAVRAVVNSLLTQPTVYPFNKARYRDSPLHNVGVHTAPLHAAARYLSDRLFGIFRQAAERSMPRGLPLLISGGCGLNCEWNRRWRESGLFREVFVAPCTNDSGSALGTAADAQAFYGAQCRLEWDVYRGQPFVQDTEPDRRLWSEQPFSVHAIAQAIAEGAVVAWAQGRCEIGPRALGHRSLLASPLRPGTTKLLNEIKERESYRPIAPCCLAEDLSRWFRPPIDDPYMLYFSSVQGSALPAITHVDGTARVQSVRPQDGSTLHPLLTAFRDLTGYGVLCNTSLNFAGHGFLNRTSELVLYCESRDIDDIVVEGRWYRRRRDPG